jgi:single-stranded-DNA-specific exonuclease
MGTPAWVIAPPDDGAAALAAALGLRLLTAALLRRRGVTTAEEARRFLDPRLEDLTDPATLPGMSAAVERAAQAIAAGARIAIHGDYDVDGISATAILLRGLQAVGADPLWHLPHRLQDGYGLGTRAVDAVAAQGARLLIAADCGITAWDAVARAQAHGVDVIILDHHAPSAERPRANIVEPARDGNADAPLCAAGLAFMFVVALRHRLGVVPAVPAGLASLAALGTIADVVPLRDDNRRLVAGGLAEMRAVPLAGLKALAALAGITGPITTWHVSWQLAPRLNAPGRLGDPSPALHLLLTDDAALGRTLAEELDRANRERQALLERTLAEAMAQAEEDAQAQAFVVAGEGWHPGVVGLVAGRLTERYRRPAVAIGLAEGSGRGSARSVSGFNLVQALNGCRSHLLGFGGHAMAAGLSIAREAVAEFRQAFNDLARVGAADRDAALRLHVDADVRLADLTGGLVDELERLGPFGAGNPEPVLAVRGVRTLHRRVIGDGTHLRLDVSDGTETIEAIGFAMAAPAELLTFTEARVDVVVIPEHDPQSPERVRLRVVALDAPGVDPERMLADTGALLDRLFGRAAEYLGEHRDAAVEDASAFYSKLVGVTFDGRQHVVATLRPGERLRLVREPANAHDPHAVQAVTEDGRALGYLRARLAGRLAPSIDAGVRYRISVAAVTGGGERPLGINIFLEREDEMPSTAEPDSALPSSKAWRHLAPGERAERLSACLNGRYALAPVHADAVAALARGASVVIAMPPGRGVASILASASAIAARDGRAALIVAPHRRQVLHRADQIRGRLAPLGLRVCALHGMQSVREREHVETLLRAGETDVVVASWEAVAGAWAESHADRIAAVLCDGAPGAPLAALLGRLRAAQVCLVNPGVPRASVESVRADTVILRDDAVRTGVRLVDRRDAADPVAVIEEVISRDEKCIVYAVGREECVHLATRLRDRAGYGGRVAYLHGGLPARVRQIIVQAFRENRIGVLVATPALDEEALPGDVRHVVLASLPPDREQLADAPGALGFGERPVSVTALFRADEIPSRRRALDARAPDRAGLATLYRVLAQWRGDEPFVWPDDATWRRLSEALPHLVPSAVDAALAIFEEAGVASRETVGTRYEIQFLSTRGDLAASLRYREGRREREAFEECARWTVRASPIQLLQAVAGKGVDGQPAPPDTGAGRAGDSPAVLQG